jgi:hypothetical protein
VRSNKSEKSRDWSGKTGTFANCRTATPLTFRTSGGVLEHEFQHVFDF